MFGYPMYFTKVIRYFFKNDSAFRRMKKVPFTKELNYLGRINHIRTKLAGPILRGCVIRLLVSVRCQILKLQNVFFNN